MGRRQGPSYREPDAVHLLPPLFPLSFPPHAGASGRVRIGRTVEAGSSGRRTIAAPRSVWEEAATLDAILSPSVGLVTETGLSSRSDSWPPAPVGVPVMDGTRAKPHTSISQPTRARRLISSPSWRSCPAFRRDVDLVSSGAATATLRLRCRLRCDHWRARRCPGYLPGRRPPPGRCPALLSRTCLTGAEAGSMFARLFGCCERRAVPEALGCVGAAVWLALATPPLVPAGSRVG